MSSRSVSTRTETRTVNGVTQTITVTEETIRHPDGRVEKKVSQKTSDGSQLSSSDGPTNGFDNFFKSVGGFGGGGGLNDSGIGRMSFTEGGGFFDGVDDDEAKQTTTKSPTNPQKEPYKPISISEFHQKTLDKHNEYRSKHGVPQLKLNKDLCAVAQDWADSIGKTQHFKHRPNCKHGENIYYAMNSRGVNPVDAVDSWYSEIKNYNFARPGFGGNTGHFTQVVWRASTELGVGVCEPTPGKCYVVANYSPAGNVRGRFPDNVLPLKK